MIFRNGGKISGLILVYLHFILCGSNSETISESNESELFHNVPPIYKMDDFDKCKSRNQSYCFAKIRLSAQPKYVELWTAFIRNLTESKCLLTPEIIERGICMDKSINNIDKGTQFAYVNKLMQNEINAIYLNADTYYLRCQDNYIIQMSNFDYFVIFIGALNITIVLIATVVEFFGSVHSKQSSVFQMLNCWSLINNWKKLIEYKTSASDDYQNLQFLAGIRTICCFIIIINHGLTNAVIVFIDEEIVNFYLNRNLSKFLSAMYTETNIFCVQTFFFLSHFLNAVQMLRYTKSQSDKMDMNFVLKRIGRRIFRYLPHLLVMTLFANSDIYKIFSSAPINDFPYFNQYFCQTNWWLMFLFISNEVRINAMCHPVGWYLSADIQLYIISTLSMYILIKYKLGTKFLIGMFILSIIIHGLNLYRVPTILASFNNANLKVDKIFVDNIYYIHISTISSLATVFAGQIYGLKYYYYSSINTSTKSVPVKTMSLILWSLYLSGPILFGATFLEIFRDDKLQNTISILLFKPLCCLFLGNLILEFTKNNYGRKLRYFLEMRFMDFVAKLSFSIYFYQGFCAFFVRFKQPYNRESLQAESNKTALIVTVLSIIMHFAVDQPIQNIIKLIGSDKRKTSVE